VSLEAFGDMIYGFMGHRIPHPIPCRHMAQSKDRHPHCNTQHRHPLPGFLLS
jgi:hypothetical protein